MSTERKTVTEVFSDQCKATGRNHALIQAMMLRMKSEAEPGADDPNEKDGWKLASTTMREESRHVEGEAKKDTSSPAVSAQAANELHATLTAIFVYERSSGNGDEEEEEPDEEQEDAAEEIIEDALADQTAFDQDTAMGDAIAEEEAPMPEVLSLAEEDFLALSESLQESLPEPSVLQQELFPVAIEQAELPQQIHGLFALQQLEPHNPVFQQQAVDFLMTQQQNPSLAPADQQLALAATHAFNDPGFVQGLQQNIAALPDYSLGPQSSDASRDLATQALYNASIENQAISPELFHNQYAPVSSADVALGMLRENAAMTEMPVYEAAAKPDYSNNPFYIGSELAMSGPSAPSFATSGALSGGDGGGSSGGDGGGFSSN